MSAIILGNASQAARLTTMLTAVPFIAGHLKLFNNNFIPSPNSLIGAFVEPTFTGYAQQAITWGTVINDPSGQPVGPSSATFRLTSGVGDVCYGAFYIDSTGALVWSTVFDGGPISFANPGDGYLLGILFGLIGGSLTVVSGP